MAETRYQMALRHIAEQEWRIAKQEWLIAQLKDGGHSTVQAEALLASMHDLLALMQEELAQITKSN